MVIRTTTPRLLMAIVAAATMAIAGCSSRGEPSSVATSSPATTPSATADPTAAATVVSSTSMGARASLAAAQPPASRPAVTLRYGTAVLRATQDPRYGTILVDSRGYAVYRFDQDAANPSTSTCTGACLTTWPAVLTTGAIQAEGVSAKLATMTRADGTKQVTVGGWPIYFYHGDGKVGDTFGQGTGQLWWLIKPDGGKVSPIT